MNDFEMVYNKMHWLHHPKIGATVTVKRPKWVPAWVLLFFDNNAGKEGMIIGVERGKYCGEQIYLVVFNTQRGSITTTGAYSKEALEFKTSGFCEKQ